MADTGKSAKRTLLHIHLEPLGEKSGVLSTTTHKIKRGGQGGGPDYEHDEAPPVHHPSMEHLTGHLLRHLKNAFPNSEAAAMDHDNEPSSETEG